MSPLASVLAVAVQIGGAAASEVSGHGFFVVPGAEEVGREPGLSPNIRYYVKDPYPATRTIDSIVTALDRHGWKAVVGKDVAPNETSSLDSGWDEFPGERRVPVRLWSARWVNAAGDEVTYSLGYSSPQMSSGMEPVYLSVSARFDTKESAARMRRQIAEETARIELALRPPASKRRPCPTE